MKIEPNLAEYKPYMKHKSLTILNYIFDQRLRTKYSMNQFFQFQISLFGKILAIKNKVAVYRLGLWYECLEN